MVKLEVLLLFSHSGHCAAQADPDNLSKLNSNWNWGQYSTYVCAFCVTSHFVSKFRLLQNPLTKSTLVCTSLAVSFFSTTIVAGGDIYFRCTDNASISWNISRTSHRVNSLTPMQNCLGGEDVCSYMASTRMI